MKKIIILISIVFAGMLFQSCSTDFDVVAPYKETMVIYGLMNSDPATKVQYIRINKAYLGEGNSIIMAQQRDSINYADGVLEVKLERIDVNGNTSSPFVVQRVDSNVKEPGVFYSPYQVIYKITNSTNSNMNPLRSDGSTYRLTVRNNQTGVTASSQTIMVDSIVNDPIFSPPAGMNFITPLLRTFSFGAVANAWVYNMAIRLHYKEVNLVSNDTVSKFVEWNLGDHVTGTSQSTISYTGVYLPDLYRVVGSTIVPADTNQLRRIIDSPPIEFVLTAATEDLYTYQQVVQPSSGIVQERPLFSNIENGIGLFTSRYMKSFFKNLNGGSLAAFDTSAYTHDIHFH